MEEMHAQDESQRANIIHDMNFNMPKKDKNKTCLLIDFN